MRVRIALVAAVVALAPSVARADTDYFGAKQVKVRVTKERTTGQRVLIYGLLAGAAISLGVGVKYHLDSRDAADAVSNDSDDPAGAWTDERQALYDRAESTGVVAIVGYSLSGAFLAGAVVAAYLTHPGEEVRELTPRTATSVTPVPGGAVVARTWRF